MSWFLIIPHLILMIPIMLYLDRHGLLDIENFSPS